MRFASRQTSWLCPEDQVSYIFIIKGKWRSGGKTTFFLILPVDIRLASLAPPLHLAGECLTL